MSAPAATAAAVAPWPGADEADWRRWEAGSPAALVPTMAETAPSGIFALELDLATADPALLSDTDLVDATVGLERIAAWARARQYAVLAEFARRRGDGSIGSAPVPAGDRRSWAADEVAMAVQLAPVAAGARLGEAARLAGVLRPTRDLLAAGRIDGARARLLVSMLATLDDDTAAAVQSRVLPRAPGQTLGQLRAAVRRAVLAVDADGAAERHRAAARARRVDLFADADGMATLWARLPAPDAAASYAWITRLARGLPSSPACSDSGGTAVGAGAEAEDRSIDARRADVLVALLTGRLQVHDPAGDPASDPSTGPVRGSRGGSGDRSDSGSGDQSGVLSGSGSGGGPVVIARPVGADRPLVQVAVPLGTLTGAGDEPGELAGFGPIPAHLAREIAADPRSTWRRLLTDPVSGVVLDHGRTVYRPPAGLADLVRARDGQCRHPACRRAASACELDHVVAWRAGGATSEANLVALCPRHHLLKEQPGWQVVLHPDRSLEWITPTGHRYRSRPADHRTPDPPDADPPRPDPPPTAPSFTDLLRSAMPGERPTGEPPPF